MGAVAICVAGQVLYHLLLRSLPASYSPFVVVIVAYSMGIVLVAGAGSLDRGGAMFGAVSFSVIARSCALGLAVAMVELGYIYAYRSGLPVGIGAVSVLAITSVALIPLGVLMFREAFTPRVAIGLVLTLAGLWLMRR